MLRNWRRAETYRTQRCSRPHGHRDDRQTDETLGMGLFFGTGPGDGVRSARSIQGPPQRRAEAARRRAGFTLPKNHWAAGISPSDFKGKKFALLESYAADGSTGAGTSRTSGRHGAEPSRATRLAASSGSRPIYRRTDFVLSQMKSVSAIGLVGAGGIFLERRQPAGPRPAHAGHLADPRRSAERSRPLAASTDLPSDLIRARRPGAARRSRSRGWAVVLEGSVRDGDVARPTPSGRSTAARPGSAGSRG